jgi:hypothetical protein
LRAGPIFRAGAPPPIAGSLSAPSLLTGSVVRIAENSQERVSIKIPIDELAPVFDGTTVQMVLSGRGWIVSAGDVAIEDLSRVIHVGVYEAVGDMIGRLDTVEAIERGAIALAI